MRLTTIAASAAALALTVGGAAVAVADPGKPGPNGKNDFGLCTAYFSGSEKGQEQKRKAPPFQGLEAAAEAEEMTVEEWCTEYGSDPGGKNNENEGDDSAE